MEKKRGFAAMDPARQREIASLGGKSVKSPRSFSVNRELAVAAGRKGGKAVPGAKRTFSMDKNFASECGKIGGLAVHPSKRTFSTDKELAKRAGALGGAASHKS